MRRSAYAALAVVLSTTAALAAPGDRWREGGPNWRGSNVTAYKRVLIAQACANLAAIKARAWRDGRITAFERYRIRMAEARLQRTIFRARHG